MILVCIKEKLLKIIIIKMIHDMKWAERRQVKMWSEHQRMKILVQWNCVKRNFFFVFNNPELMSNKEERDEARSIQSKLTSHLGDVDACIFFFVFVTLLSPLPGTQQQSPHPLQKQHHPHHSHSQHLTTCSSVSGCHFQLRADTTTSPFSLTSLQGVIRRPFTQNHLSSSTWWWP